MAKKVSNRSSVNHAAPSGDSSPLLSELRKLIKRPSMDTKLLDSILGRMEQRNEWLRKYHFLEKNDLFAMWPGFEDRLDKNIQALSEMRQRSVKDQKKLADILQFEGFVQRTIVEYYKSGYFPVMAVFGFIKMDNDLKID